MPAHKQNKVWYWNDKSHPVQPGILPYTFNLSHNSVKCEEVKQWWITMYNVCCFFAEFFSDDTHHHTHQQPILTNITFQSINIKCQKCQSCSTFWSTQDWRLNVDIMSQKILYIHKRFLKRLHYHRPIPTCILRTVIMLIVHRDKIQIIHIDGCKRRNYISRHGNEHVLPQNNCYTGKRNFK